MKFNLVKYRRKILFGAAAVALAAVVFLGEALKPLEAELLRVEKRSIARTLQEEGFVVPAAEHPVFSVYGGRIVDLRVEEGDVVEKGEVLAVFDARDLHFQLAQLQAQLESIKGDEARMHQEPYRSQLRQQELLVEKARLDLEAARTNFARIEALYKSGAISTKEYEEALKAVKAAENTLEQQEEALSLLVESHKPGSGTGRYYAGMKESLQAQIEAVKHKIEESRITAPAAGVVADLAVREGMVVPPGSPLMTIFQKDSYLVEVFVLAGDAGSLKEGMKVELVQDGAGGDLVFDGVVEKIAPAAVEKISPLGLKEQRVKVTVKPEAPNTPGLRPGCALDVRFTLEKQEGRLVVPKTALFPYRGGEAVWVVRRGRAKIQPVKKGFENDREVVIEKGLQEGDRVVLDLQLAGLKEGKRVADRS